MDWITKYFFQYERDFDPWPAVVFLEDNWHHSITLSLIYVVTIFTIQHLLKDRQPFVLKKPLFLWNSMLAIFSIIGATRAIPGMMDIVSHGNLYSSICIREDRLGHVRPLQKVFALWTLLFALSKPVELIDTLFLVLRKKPLIFLHWYHHITVMVYTFHAVQQLTPTGRWFLTINYIIHSLMYVYFAVRSLNMRLPKFIGMTITVLQILQMVVGVCVTGVVIYAKSHGWKCLQTNENLAFALLIYLSYLLLFTNFFYNAYITKRKKAAQAKLKKEDDSLHNENNLNNNNITKPEMQSYMNGDTNAHKRSMHKALPS